jgi:hypothetical protein
MMKATEIAFFDNLCQAEYNSKYFDFHNDFDCTSMVFSATSLYINFRHILDREEIAMCFSNVQIVDFSFFNSAQEDGLTIDTLYRGKFSEKEILIETSESGQAYFYLEFYEGQRMEFWADGLYVS